MSVEIRLTEEWAEIIGQNESVLMRADEFLSVCNKYANPLHVSVLTERFPEDDPNHLCRVGLSFRSRRLMADCFATDEAFKANKSVDRKIAAIEVALEKLFAQVLL